MRGPFGLGFCWPSASGSEVVRRQLELTNLDEGSWLLGLPAAVGSARLRPVG